MIWINRPLGEVCEILDNLRKPITKRDRKSGEIPYYGATGVVDWVDDFIFNEKLVLVGEDGAKWKRGDKTAFIIDGKAWVNNHAHVLRPYDGVLIHEWLEYYLTSIDLSPWVHGATVPKLNQTQLRSIPIPIPPLSEQQRIVAKLDAAFTEIDEAVQLVNKRYNNTTSLIATAQNALFEDMPLSIPRLRLSEAAKFENGDRGKNYPSKKYQLSEGIPFVNAGDFSLDGDITRDGMAYISEERFDLLGAGKFQKEDILFCLRGSLGKSAINKTLKRGAIASSLVIIRALQNIYPDYLFAFLRSDIVKKYISETAGGTAQPNLSAKVVMGYEIPVPSLQEQEAIADKFWALRLQGLKLNSLIKKKKSEFMVLKSAILKQELQSSEAA